jgi:hypothetical protein
MAVQFSGNFMAYELDGEIVATARFSQHAAADGQGAWIVSTRPARLFTYAQALTALVLAGRLAAGFDRTDPHVKTWRTVLRLPNDDVEDAKHARSGNEGRH